LSFGSLHVLAYLVNQPQLIKEGVSTVGNLLSVTPDYSCVATFLKLYYSSMVRFEWDEAKAKTNERKHGVRFEDAMLVFC